MVQPDKALKKKALYSKNRRLKTPVFAKKRKVRITGKNYSTGIKDGQSKV